MKLAVVIPPATFLIDDRAFLSLGPIQIATVARDFAGWRVEVLDLTGHARRCLKINHDDLCEQEVWAHCEAQIAMTPADVYGLYGMSCHVRNCVRLAAMVKKHWPKAVIVAGGPHASMQPDDFLRNGFDAAVVAQTGGGGGELGLMEVLGDVALFGRVRQQKYASFNDPNPARWSWPDRALVDWQSYAYRIDGERAGSIVSQFGCPYVCVFCSHGPGYTKVRYRDLEHVAAELREMRRRFSQRAVMLYDVEVNLRRDHFEGLCGVLSDGGWRWRAFIKSNIFTEEHARLAAESGAAEFCTGAESADPDIKKAILKKSTVEHDTNFVEWCWKYGIAAKVFTQVGLPGESRESALRTKDWLLRMARAAPAGLFHFDVTVTTPYPGTPIYDAPEKHGLRVVRPLDFAHEEVIYKGKPGEYQSFTETEHLRAAEIVALRDEIERDVLAVMGKSAPVVGVERNAETSRSGAPHRDVRQIDGG